MLIVGKLFEASSGLEVNVEEPLTAGYIGASHFHEISTAAEVQLQEPTISKHKCLSSNYFYSSLGKVLEANQRI